MSQSSETTARRGRSKWQKDYQEKHPLRNRIVVFLDGTSNDKKSETNVWRLHEQCNEHENFRGVRQVKCYIEGVRGLNGSLYGSGLELKLVKAYTFICQKWKSEYDEIVLVGFSRGGFSVQLLALFLNDLGIAEWKPPARLGSAQGEYKKTFEKDIENKIKEWEKEKGLGCQRYSRNAIIMACGVWDAVAALEGAGGKHRSKPERKQFRFAYHRLPPNVRNAFHALSLNENRRAFEPVLWHQTQPQPEQTLKQCWFLGCHSDVGGHKGNLSNGMPDVTLVWMMAQLEPFVLFRTEPRTATLTMWPSVKDLRDDEVKDSRRLLYKLDKSEARRVGEHLWGFRPTSNLKVTKETIHWNVGEWTSGSFRHSLSDKGQKTWKRLKRIRNPEGDPPYCWIVGDEEHSLSEEQTDPLELLWLGIEAVHPDPNFPQDTNRKVFRKEMERMTNVVYPLSSDEARDYEWSNLTTYSAASGSQSDFSPWSNYETAEDSDQNTVTSYYQTGTSGDDANEHEDSLGLEDRSDTDPVARDTSGYVIEGYPVTQEYPNANDNNDNMAGDTASISETTADALSTEPGSTGDEQYAQEHIQLPGPQLTREVSAEEDVAYLQGPRSEVEQNTRDRYSLPSREPHKDTNRRHRSSRSSRTAQSSSGSSRRHR
ncbi:uncharacterized protein LY89DRAFT_57769 [Mollisia scopiformis]|uniref:T6SS Phospholipase effector Tle1-like catalytic domain-containing protein n=1 Tax=Mollisia scopiformis TaxID=149040 RepID=A0A194XBP2_MOLSC|nr:uncharacterized protein LY89DRAFT_57769 [Mollisia scopiformis]KUJ17581.1 hypothetical protein LY89DRAFT_57769 [Mollisia scopiformis]